MINGIKEVIVELVTGIVEALGIKELNKVLDSLESKMVGSYKDWEK